MAFSNRGPKQLGLVGPLPTEEPLIQGICKDCGNSTMNNNLYQAFDLSEDNDGNEVLYCSSCGSTHLDIP